MANQSFLVISSGGENGVRTRDLRLGKPTLYQLSYFRNSTVIHPFNSANIVIKIRFARFFLTNFKPPSVPLHSRT